MFSTVQKGRITARRGPRDPLHLVQVTGLDRGSKYATPWRADAIMLVLNFLIRLE
jgi:hypothetical protein